MLLILLQKSSYLHFSWLLFTSLKHLPVNLLDLLNKLTKISLPICSYKFYTIPYTPGIVEFTGSPGKEISAGICYLSIISKKSEEENIDYNLWRTFCGIAVHKDVSSRLKEAKSYFQVIFVIFIHPNFPHFIKICDSKCHFKG